MMTNYTKHSIMKNQSILPTRDKRKHGIFSCFFDFPVNLPVFAFIVFSFIFILLSRESDQSTITSSLRDCRSSVYHFKMGESR